MLVTREAEGVYQPAVRSLRELAIPLAFLGLWLGLSSCGGSGASGPGAKTGKHAKAEEETRGEGEEGESEAAEAPAPRCSDGACFECGSGICPKGFYCDEKAGGCGWLPECASNASCGCVKAGLGGSCSCEERAGGSYVKCD